MVRPRTRSSVASRADRKITGVVHPRRRSRSHSSKPSTSGSITSSTMTSGRKASAALSAA
jgi:hypothetical protein